MHGKHGSARRQVLGQDIHCCLGKRTDPKDVLDPAREVIRWMTWGASNCPKATYNRRWWSGVGSDEGGPGIGRRHGYKASGEWCMWSGGWAWRALDVSAQLWV
eukprot:1148769-Pelagomonas_calceolata.AAC.1